VAYHLGRDAPHAERLRFEVPQGGTDDLDGEHALWSGAPADGGQLKDAVTGGEEATDRRTPG
jgi:hypothetical protein